jgi:hypothetical protein
VDVVIDQEPLAGADDVALGLEIEALQVGVLMDLLALGSHHVGRSFADVVRGLRHVAVVQQ